MKGPFFPLLFLIAAGQVPAAGKALTPALDALSEQLSWSNADQTIRAHLSGTIDLEGYLFEDEPPALIRSGKDWTLQPRATLFLDLQAGKALYGFAQARVDRGFDPADQRLRLRLDEYALRLTPWEDGRLRSGHACPWPHVIVRHGAHVCGYWTPDFRNDKTRHVPALKTG